MSESERAPSKLDPAFVEIPGQVDDHTPEYLKYPEFSDLGGLTAAIDELKAVADLIVDTDAFEDYDIIRPNGILLVGPGGVGKTQLAKAFARECSATYVEVEVSSLLKKFVGESNQALRDVFTEATKPDQDNPNRVVVLFNEIDGFFGGNSGGNEGVSKALVAEFKSILENLQTQYPNVIVVGTTNMMSGFDPALLRSGRFDVVIQIQKPNLEERSSILSLIVSQRTDLYNLGGPEDPEAEDIINLREIAEATEDMTGADIKGILSACRFALAIRDKKTQTHHQINQSDLLRAIDHHRRSRLSDTA